MHESQGRGLEKTVKAVFQPTAGDLRRRRADGEARGEEKAGGGEAAGRVPQKEAR